MEGRPTSGVFRFLRRVTGATKHPLSPRLALAIISAAAACGGRAAPRKSVAPNVVLGDCADPKLSGVLSPKPKLQSAHRDLNGDGVKELAFADRALCRGKNCSWNLFTKSEGCSRYIGTVEGNTLEVTETRADAGFATLRVWWRMAKGARFLVQTYAYRGEGYKLADVLVCRQDGDDRLLCASEEPQEPSTVH